MLSPYYLALAQLSVMYSILIISLTTALMKTAYFLTLGTAVHHSYSLGLRRTEPEDVAHGSLPYGSKKLLS